jgi:pre-mRNA-splicing factor RBM22/SLT11
MQKGGNIDEKIKERFNGINDPVAKKILSKVKEVHLPQPPADLNITTVFVGGIDDSIDEDDL